MKAPTDGAKGYRRLIPSLTALVEFEAVARLRSFTKAADELGVTQAAVSRQVRLLEDQLGVRLLDRQPRATTPTAEGDALHAVVAEGMGKIAGMFDRLMTGIEDEELVLATTATFSHYHLMPSVAKLKRLHPNVRIRITTTMFTADLRHNEVGGAVRWGDGKWADGSAEFLFDELVFPVCSPAWIAEHGVPQDLEALSRAQLIGYDPTSEGWLTWETWFRRLGLHPAKLHYGIRTCLYGDTVQAALHGQGIALGWGKLLHKQLAAGELIRLTDASLKLDEAYYLVVPHGKAPTPAIRTLAELLRQSAGVE
ncbi:MAG: LysR substrate-binding domain-containing protein [Burkholderia gladioli]